MEEVKASLPDRVLSYQERLARIIMGEMHDGEGYAEFASELKCLQWCEEGKAKALALAEEAKALKRNRRTLFDELGKAGF